MNNKINEERRKEGRKEGRKEERKEGLEILVLLQNYERHLWEGGVRGSKYNALPSKKTERGQHTITS